MPDNSLAARAVAQGPLTVAPPSFDGHGWLVVINLAFFTAMAVIAASFWWEQVKALWRYRRRDRLGHPVTIWRWMGFCLFLAISLRCGVGAWALWRWNPGDPAGTAAALTLQRFVDPVALAFGLCAMTLFMLSARGMVPQLRREPLELRMWASLPMLKRPAMILAASMLAAIGVVSLR